MPTKSTARTEMIYELERLQDELEIHWLNPSLPDDWTGMESADPIDPDRTRVTLRLDSDMLRWFRKLGPGYQRRINRVLRVYWLALVCGQIKAFPMDDTTPRKRQDMEAIAKGLRMMRAKWREEG
ncbi:MAG: BrnA antitoxin family protein [Pseudomonadota bacterium]